MAARVITSFSDKSFWLYVLVSEIAIISATLCGRVAHKPKRKPECKVMRSVILL